MSGLQLKKGLSALLGAVSLILAAAMPAAADDADEASWKFDAEIYLWGAGMDVETVAGDDIEVSFGDLLKNLEMAFMGSVRARKDGWTLVGDAIYLDLAADTKGTANIVGHPAETKLDLELKALILNLLVGHSVFRNDSTQINLLAGARYLKLEDDMKFQIGGLERKASGSGSGWDGIVGISGQSDINDSWYVNYYADIGKGESEKSWQALASVGYRFEKVDAVFGYRHLEWNFDDNAKVIDALSVSGPFAGVRFQF